LEKLFTPGIESKLFIEFSVTFGCDGMIILKWLKKRYRIKAKSPESLGLMV
jgi:hypothetical protein